MTNKTLPRAKVRKFRLWTYDVWGNARDGFDVNDRYSQGYVTIRCKAKTYNAGTANEFTTYEPTDRQLSRAAGFSRVTWDGSDGSFYAEATSNGEPIGELTEENAE